MHPVKYSASSYFRNCFLWIFSLLLVGLVSCKKDLKSNFDNVSWRPYVEAPLLNSEVQVSDFLNPDSLNYLTADSTGQLIFNYRFDSVLYYNADQIFGIGDISLGSVSIDAPAVPFSVTQDLPFAQSGGAHLNSVVFASGQFSLHADAQQSSVVVLHIGINNATQNGQPVSWQFTLPVNGQSDTTFNLTGLKVQFPGGASAQNLSFNFTADPQTPGANVNTTLSGEITGLKIAFADGYLGEFTLPPVSDTNKIAQFDQNFSVDVFNAPNATYEMILTNGTGIPFSGTVDAVGQGATQDYSLGTVSAQQPAAASPGDTTVTHNYASLDIPNATNWLQDNPASFILNSLVHINQGQPDGYNFIDSSSYIEMDALVKTPFNVQIGNLIYQKTVGQNFFQSISDSVGIDQVKQVDLILDYQNGMPLNIQTKLTFLDSVTGHVIDTFNFLDLNPAQVDANGKVISDGSGTITVTVNQARLDSLSQSNAMTLYTIVNTSPLQNSQNAGAVWITPQTAFKAHLGARAQLEIK